MFSLFRDMTVTNDKVICSCIILLTQVCVWGGGGCYRRWKCEIQVWMLLGINWNTLHWLETGIHVGF